LAYLESGDYFWNSGIFMMKASVWLSLIHQFRPDIAAAAARLHHGSDPFTPGSEADYDLLLRRAEGRWTTEAEFMGELLRDYLKPDAAGHFSGSVRSRRRAELLDYAHKGLLGLGAEKASAIAAHPTPCAELWRRKYPR
ncbi:MAG TPA: hypothetical protein P5284_10970, partial [Candidatus Contendobacter sp.]|nr:hypothetical protein [Candidatus Contendobacter sp.]